MLSLLIHTMRLKAAPVLAVLYALTVLAPHIAMAFAGPGSFSHCFKHESPVHDHSVSASAVHFHADGTTHSHGNGSTAPANDDSNSPTAACCGLFSTSAVVTDLRVLVPVRVITSQILPFPMTGVDGQGPGRIIRPPIA